jgi:exodeoxyribonuclease VII large subunit
VRANGPVPEYQIVPVGRLAKYITRRLSDDPKLKWLGVRGEVSGLSIQANGNVYFDLKDRDALINCVMWSEAAASLPGLVNGDEVIAVGNIGTFEKRSRYQLIVYLVEQGGVGRLHAVYEKLKSRLDAEGLFASDRKRALPKFPFTVGLVSSRTANGAGDFLTQAASLAPHVRIELFETPVQGESAAPEIVRAIERASRASLDLVVLARGGGSYEDLFVFNDERVVRALARCTHPTVSAIGHEADVPLTDFVADFRAPTPSTAAQTILPRRADLLRAVGVSRATLDRTLGRAVSRLENELRRIAIRSALSDPARFLAPRRQRVDSESRGLGRAVAAQLRAKGDRVRDLQRRLEARSPSAQLAARRERLTVATYGLARYGSQPLAQARRSLERLTERLEPVMRRALEKRAANVRLWHAHLDGKDPVKILQRGYAIVSSGGRTVTDAATLGAGAIIEAQLAHGTLTARVETKATDGRE